LLILPAAATETNLTFLVSRTSICYGAFFFSSTVILIRCQNHCTVYIHNAVSKQHQFIDFGHMAPF